MGSAGWQGTKASSPELLMQDDLRDLLDALGMFSGAQPRSPHEVMRSAIERAREQREALERIANLVQRSMVKPEDKPRVLVMPEPIGHLIQEHPAHQTSLYMTRPHNTIGEPIELGKGDIVCLMRIDPVSKEKRIEFVQLTSDLIDDRYYDLIRGVEGTDARAWQTGEPVWKAVQ
jgi:hypothetical protein